VSSFEVRPRQNVPIPRYQLTRSTPNLLLKASNKLARAYVPLKAKYSESSVIDDYLHESGDFAEVDYLGYKMPGSNKEKSHDWCGTWGAEGCLKNEAHPEDKVYAKKYKRSCFIPLCPVCKNDWLYREANRATERIDYYSKLTGMPAKHLVWSPASYNPVCYKSLKSLRRACYEGLKEVGVKASMVIFHAYRDRVYNGFKQWYYSPHFHIIGHGWIDGTPEYQKKSNCVIKNLGVRESVLATVIYQLSHCSIKEKHHAVTWMGGMSYSKLKMPVKDVNTKKCPYCDTLLVRLAFCDGYDPPPDGVEEGLYEKGMFCVVGVKDDSTRQGIGSYCTELV